jgi:exosortase B
LIIAPFKPVAAANEEDVSRAQRLRFWAPLIVGVLVLYVPTYWDLYNTFWQTREGSYGAVMFFVIAWLVWRERAVFMQWDVPARRGVGVALFVAGALFYMVGRSQRFYQLEVGSQIPLLFGLAYLFLGKQGVRRLAFPLLMLVFVIPVPGSLADQLLLPLKELVSRIVDHALHWAGYPIARNGVVLFIGPYSLLIADACSGLNSMIALSGIGLIYTYLAGHTRRAFNVAVLLSILPIAFAANVVRVLTLVLITYYGGDGAGSAFHDQAAYLEIALAFGAFFALDMILKSTGAATERLPVVSNATGSLQ